jgi:hypothetical protein
MPIANCRLRGEDSINFRFFIPGVQNNSLPHHRGGLMRPGLKLSEYPGVLPIATSPPRVFWSCDRLWRDPLNTSCMCSTNSTGTASGFFRNARQSIYRRPVGPGTHRDRVGNPRTGMVADRRKSENGMRKARLEGKLIGRAHSTWSRLSGSPGEFP